MLFESLPSRKRPLGEFILIVLIIAMGLVSLASYFIPAFNGMVAMLVLKAVGG